MGRSQKKGWRLGLILMFFVLGSSSAAYADWEDILSMFHPHITAQEDYNSNINLTSTNKKNDYITTVSPGLKFTISDKPNQPSGLDLDFNAGFVFYGREKDNNYIGLNGGLNAWYSLTPKLTFRVRDYLIRSDEIREQDYSATAVEGQTLLAREFRRAVYIRNVFEPSVEYRFGKENDLIEIHYRYNVYNIQSRINEDSVEHFINPQLTYWFTIRHGVQFEYGLDIGDFQHSPDLLGHLGRMRYTYRFNPWTSVFVGYSHFWRDFKSSESPTTDYQVYRPSIGIQHTFNPKLSGTAEFGYYWEDPDRGSTLSGFYYNALLTQKAGERTTFTLSGQGGYTEDYFTAQNLGFTQTHRAIGTVSYQLLQRMTVSGIGSYEWVKYARPGIGGEKQKDNIWRIGADTSYQILKWLSASLGLSYRENHSNIDTANYTEYRGVFRMTAAF